jgi:hypothetical protein
MKKPEKEAKERVKYDCFSAFWLIHTSGKNSPKNTFFYQVLRPGKVRFADLKNRVFFSPI